MSTVTGHRADTKGSRWRRVCRILFNNPLFKPMVSSRKRRRRLAVGYGLILIAFPLVAWLTGSLLAVAVVSLLYLLGTLMIAVATGGILDKPIRILDERQRQARWSLFGDPYATGASLGVAGGLIIAFSLQAEDALALGIFMFVFGFLFGLPAMLYTWSIPDADDEDE